MIHENDLCECGHIAEEHHYNASDDEGLTGGCMVVLWPSKKILIHDENYCPCMKFRHDKFIQYVRLANDQK